MRRFGPIVVSPLLYLPILMRHLERRYAVIWHGQPSEPRHTIYVDRWRKALARVRLLEGEQRRLFAELLAHVDTGWRHVRQLQLEVERLATPSAKHVQIGDVLTFIDVDVVDLYREIAFDAADLVPGWDGWAQAADPGNMDGDATLFMRYMSMLRLAAASDELPRQLRDVSTEVWAELQGWEAGFTRLLRSIDKAVILPSLSEPSVGSGGSGPPRFGEDSSIG